MAGRRRGEGERRLPFSPAQRARPPAGPGNEARARGNPSIREPGPPNSTAPARACGGFGEGGTARSRTVTQPQRNRRVGTCRPGGRGRRGPRYCPAPARPPTRRAPGPARPEGACRPSPPAAESGEVSAAGPLPRAPAAGAVLWFRCRPRASGLMSSRHASCASGLPAPRPLLAGVPSPRGPWRPIPASPSKPLFHLGTRARGPYWRLRVAEGGWDLLGALG